MTIAEFIKKRLIVESKNDYLLDVPSAWVFLTEEDDEEDPNDMQIWMEDYLFPEITEEEIEYINTQDFPDDSSLKSALEANDFYYASKIIKGVLESFCKKPRESYFINDVEGIHITVPLKLLK